MTTNRPELWCKFNSLVNKYGSDKEFVAHMYEWPRTIKELVFNSEKLMTRFRLTVVKTSIQPSYNDPRSVFWKQCLNVWQKGKYDLIDLYFAYEKMRGEPISESYFIGKLFGDI